jgi:hypothetical protein
MRPREWDKIPLEFQGKGPNGYMLYELIYHRGSRAPHVTERFKKMVQWRGTARENHLNQEELRRMKVGGPRFALMKKLKGRKY